MLSVGFDTTNGKGRERGMMEALPGGTAGARVGPEVAYCATYPAGAVTFAFVTDAWVETT